MCHNQLRVDLGKNINFLVGENGSGKSAVLVGIQLGLGGKTTNTGRGSTSTVVMHHKESALIRITLYNEGDDAYEPKRYGDLIAVERIIKRSNGASTYKISNATTKKTISTKKSDLALITDHFDIQVDNPIAILCQEEAKKFIKSKDAHSMYSNFMKATQMDKMSLDYTTLDTDLRIMKQRIQNKKGGSSALEQDFIAAEKKFKDLQKLRDMEEKKQKLLRECVWASIREREEVVEEKRADVASLQDLAGKIEKKIEKWNDKHIRFGEELVDAKEVLTARTAEMDAKTSLYEDAKRELQQVRAERKKDEQSRTSIERDLKEKEGALKRLQQQMEEENAKNDENEGNDERQEQQSAIDELEKTLNTMRADKQKANHDMDNALDDVRRVDAKITDAEARVNECHGHVTAAKGQVANIKQMSAGGGGISNRIAMYGAVHSKINNAIRKERWQDSEPPIGPLGAYVDLKDESWSVAVEKCLGKTQISYACANQKDRDRLRALINQVGGHNGRFIDVLMTSRESRFKVKDYLTPDLKREGVYTMEQMVSIGNDHAYNMLINSCKLERIGCAESGPEVRRIIYESGNDCGNVGLFYTKDGDKAHPGAGQRYYANRDKRHPARLAAADVDMSAKLVEAQDEAERCNQEFEGQKQAKKDLLAHKQSKQKLVKDAERRLKQFKQRMSKIEKEIDAKTKKMDDAKTAFTPVDTTYFEVELESTQQECSELAASKDKALEAELEKRKAEKPVKQKLDQAKAEAEELSKSLVAADGKINELTDKQKDSKRKMGEYSNDLRKTKSDIANSEAELNVIEDGLKDELETAGKMRTERIATKKTSGRIKSEIDAISERISLETKKRGDPSAITDEFMSAKETWENATRDIKNLETFCTMIDDMLKVRQGSLQNFKKYVGRTTKTEFQEALSSRNYTGKMTFQHDAERISFTVNPREVDKKVMEAAKDTSKETGAANTLSGGERSFTTASFILALWASMESPFRALDEFDVFMDAVNRQIAIKMMIDAARRKKDKQFILLSPLTMKIIKGLDGPDIKIIRMTPPERGQATLVQSQLNN